MKNQEVAKMFVYGKPATGWKATDIQKFPKVYQGVKET